ncbi:hypothetical protein [Evansella clarkii]|uniref:hypothetical protein n=1 Tax=Evansella clarkii TaxID=79879 RepID=UPI001C477066|nr:hypothetical protein [Evansella clarkii]
MQQEIRFATRRCDIATSTLFFAISHGDIATSNSIRNKTVRYRNKELDSQQDGVLSQQAPSFSQQDGVLSQQAPSFSQQDGVLSQQAPQFATRRCDIATSTFFFATSHGDIATSTSIRNKEV